MKRRASKSAGKNGSGKKPAQGPADAERSPSISESPGLSSRTFAASREGEKVGRYKLKKLIGRGGMGVVYDAYDSQVHRSIAIKLLHGHLVENRERRARFLREARLGAKLKHPNIVAVYEVGEMERDIFITMERLDGHSLRQKIEECPRGLPVSEAVRIARDIAAGVGEAHAQGVIHRDIKPENVLICRDGAVKLLDFGLAKAFSVDDAASASAATDIATGEGVVAGTAAYMAPEQARGENLDARADVFAIGVVLYEMLAGKRPFRGKTNFEIQAALLRDPPPPLVNVAAGLEQIVLRCLDKQPAARFADATALVAALDVATWVHKRPLSNKGKGVWLIAAALMVVFVPLLVHFFVADPPVGPVEASATASVPSTVPVPIPEHFTLENLPRPKFENHPRAKYAYGEALRFMRNAKWGAAEDELRKALNDYDVAKAKFEEVVSLLEKEPESAQAKIVEILRAEPDVATLHVRLAIAKMDYFAIDKEGLAHHRIATAPTAQLSDYDRALVNALSPMFEAPKPHIKRTIENLEGISEKYSNYSELFLFLASLYRYDTAGKRKQAAVTARTLDPLYADALQMEAVAVFEENPKEALEILRQCADKTGATSDCLGERARLQNLMGFCQEARNDIDIALDRVNPSAWILGLYPHLLFRNELNVESFRNGYKEQWTRVMRPTGEADQKNSLLDPGSYLHATFDAAYGQFETAQNSLATLKAQAKTPGAEIEWMLVEIARETGKHNDAATLAKQYLDKHPSDSGHLDDLTMYMARIALKEKKISPGDYNTIRIDIQGKWENARPSLTPIEEAQTWSTVYVMGLDLMEDPERAQEAKTALAALGGNAVVDKLRYDYGPNYFPRLVALGVARYYAGDIQSAMGPLEATYKRCDASRSIFSAMRSNLLYAQALEAEALVAPNENKKKDSCAVYQSIIERWGKSSPPSATATAAAAALQRLSCAKSP